MNIVFVLFLVFCVKIILFYVFSIIFRIFWALRNSRFSRCFSPRTYLPETGIFKAEIIGFRTPSINKFFMPNIQENLKQERWWVLLEGSRGLRHPKRKRYVSDGWHIIIILVNKISLRLNFKRNIWNRTNCPDANWSHSYVLNTILLCNKVRQLCLTNVITFEIF